jgi:hypothetical protein
MEHLKHQFVRDWLKIPEELNIEILKWNLTPDNGIELYIVYSTGISTPGLYSSKGGRIIQ